MGTMVSIVIVNYNGLNYLSDCLASISQYVTAPHEVIIVDNASTDGSREYLQHLDHKAIVILNDRNMGFSAANNIGVRRAHGDLLLLLNNDTKLLTPIDAAIGRFEDDQKLGVLGGRMYYADGSFQPSIGYEHTPLRIVLSWTGLGTCRIAPSIFRLTDNREEHYVHAHEPVSWIYGAFLMTRKSLWDQLGGLDETYFMYVEEADYCVRVHQSGFRVAYDPQVRIIHYCGSARKQTRNDAFVHTMSSYIIYVNKFYGRRSELFLRAALSAVMALRSIVLYVLAFISRNANIADKARANVSAARQLILSK